MASRKHKTLEKWLELIELHKQSKLTIVDFCSQHHLVVKTFSRKRSDLMKAKEAFHSTFVKLTPEAEVLATEPPQEVAMINPVRHMKCNTQVADGLILICYIVRN